MYYKISAAMERELLRSWAFNSTVHKSSNRVKYLVKYI